MKLSEQVEKVLTEIQNIEVPETLSPWEAGRAFYEKFLPLAGKKEAVFQIIEKELINEEHLKDLPPTFVAVAQYDPLKDEGILYAEKLKVNDINVKLKLYPGTTHGFFQMGGFIGDTKVLMQDMVQFLNTQNSLS